MFASSNLKISAAKATTWNGKQLEMPLDRNREAAPAPTFDIFVDESCAVVSDSKTKEQTNPPAQSKRGLTVRQQLETATPLSHYGLDGGATAAKPTKLQSSSNRTSKKASTGSTVKIVGYFPDEEHISFEERRAKALLKRKPIVPPTLNLIRRLPDQSGGCIDNFLPTEYVSSPFLPKRRSLLNLHFVEGP